jgi:hypothetical protein
MHSVVGVLVRRSGAGERRWVRRRAIGWEGDWRAWVGIAAWEFMGFMTGKDYLVHVIDAEKRRCCGVWGGLAAIATGAF